MPGENPGAYDEARKRIRESSENEQVVIEKKKEDFERGKEKIHSRKKLDVFELKRRIETGNSLSTLKSDIEEALRSGQISIDIYTNTLDLIDKREHGFPFEVDPPEYTLSSTDFPFGKSPLTEYFENKKIGENIVVDIAGFVYGFTQGSVFLLYILGRIIFDTLLLPRDIYKALHKL